jgi:hypothetical protein
VTSERGPQDGGNADRVLVDMRLDVIGPDDVFVGLQRDDAPISPNSTRATSATFSPMPAASAMTTA